MEVIIIKEHKGSIIGTYIQITDTKRPNETELCMTTLQVVSRNYKKIVFLLDIMKNCYANQWKYLNKTQIYHSLRKLLQWTIQGCVCALSDSFHRRSSVPSQQGHQQHLWHLCATWTPGRHIRKKEKPCYSTGGSEPELCSHTAWISLTTKI